MGPVSTVSFAARYFCRLEHAARDQLLHHLVDLLLQALRPGDVALLKGAAQGEKQLRLQVNRGANRGRRARREAGKEDLIETVKKTFSG